MNGLLNKVTQGDCLEVMKKIPDKSVDMILCDLPYGTTACKWDTIIPYVPLWSQYERIIKDNGAIVLTASQPFTSALVMSNPKLFKYEWIYEKTKSSNFLLAKKQPMKHHESVLVFSKKPHNYYPQMVEVPENQQHKRKKIVITVNKSDSVVGSAISIRKLDNGLRYPKSIQTFNNSDKTKQLHPTQKPVALFEYLIKTYTKEGDVVLDNCLGSGTTAVAAINTNRHYIGIEQEHEYVEIANQRINDALQTKEKRQ